MKRSAPLKPGKGFKRKQKKPRAAASVPARDPHTRDWINEAAMAA